MTGRFHQAVTLTIFFCLSMLWMTTKNYVYQFSNFLENFFSSNGRNRRKMRIIDFFEILTRNSLTINKNFETNFGMSRALFWVAEPKEKKSK